MTDSPDSAPRRPDLAFVHAHPAHWIAFGGGAGLAPFAPGTFGTLLGFPLDWAARVALPVGGRFALCLVLFLVGTWAAGAAGRALGAEDHGGIVCDEAVAFMLVLLLIPGGWLWAGVGFLAFRLFDIWKPGLVDAAQGLPGGWGVVLDDVLAGLLAGLLAWPLDRWLGAAALQHPSLWTPH